jgi:tetratricopeptide (TPR) repeat protein
MSVARRQRWGFLRGVCILFGLLAVGWGVGAQERLDHPVKAEPPEFRDPPVQVVRYPKTPSVLDEKYLPPPADPDHKELWEAMRRDTTKAEAFYQLGNAYYDESQLELARRAFSEALRRDAKHLPSRVNLGVVLNEMGETDEAIQHLTEAVKQAPDDIMALCNLGLAFYAKQEFAKAVKMYLKALSIDPESQLAHYNLGVAFADAGIYKEAIREWEAVVRADPRSEAARQAQDNIRVLRNLMRQGE